MYDALSPIRDFIVFDEISIDNKVFRLHYKATMFILVAFGLLLSQTQFLGDPIDCMTNGNLDQDLLDSFCWIQSTYILPDFQGGSYAGVGNEHKTNDSKHEKKFHSYYQWITLFLYFQVSLIMISD